MPEQQDFERAWLAKLSDRLDEIAGEETRREVMRGSGDLSARSGRQEVIAWSKDAMERLDALVGTEERKQIMTGCACQYPRADLQEVRERYEETGEIALAHRMLQERFERFLRETLQLEEGLVEEVVSRGWGLAGVLEGDRIIATKIPKSGYLKAYMAERSPERRRAYYCHCPRVRDAVKEGVRISDTYCYCGAGFYKGIWEEITQEAVEVEMLESVLAGGEVCRVAIYLPRFIEGSRDE